MSSHHCYRTRPSCAASLLGCRQHSAPPVVLDIQCFHDNDNKYIVKEACIVDVDTGTLLLHHVARPPYDRDLLNEDKLRESYWLTKHCHGLEWDQGDVPYHVLIDKVRSCLARRTVIYVKGAEKRLFVCENLLVPHGPRSYDVVVDTADIGCGPISTVGNLLASNVVRCGQHKHVKHRCALATCTLLRGWLHLTGGLRRNDTKENNSNYNNNNNDNERGYDVVDGGGGPSNRTTPL